MLVADDAVRCSWAQGPEYAVYHDEEWGRPVTDDRRLFEKLCLEGFQAGLSWLTILRKRPAFRQAFAGFDPESVAGFGEGEVAALLANPAIVRHEAKIRSTINNGRAVSRLVTEEGSFARWIWAYAEPNGPAQDPVPAFTPNSKRLAADLKKRGFTFVGPTTVYAFMQSVGLVNDHDADCSARERCARARAAVLTAGI
jgi:DNA-3-methyladenine glycosylase I